MRHSIQFNSFLFFSLLLHRQWQDCLVFKDAMVAETGMVTVRFEAVVQDATISSLRYCYTSYHSSYIYLSCERGHDHIALGS